MMAIISTIRVSFCLLILLLAKRLEAEKCTCVPFYQCSDDESVISDGRGLIEIRNEDQCKGVLEVCCNIISAATITEDLAKQPKGCGFQNHESFPWSSSLLYKQYPNFVPSYKCRISLIHAKVAITAAHCLQETGYYQVRIASTIRTVTQIFTHPLFKFALLQNDIAILILNRPFKMDKIGTVCIPPPGIDLDGVNCTTTTRVEEKKETLKVIHLSIVPRDDCVGIMRKNRLGRSFQLDQSFICAGGDVDQDTCGGEGGNPLICPVPEVPGRYQQGGIVSWGLGCGDNIPGVYVNLAHYREWIDEVMIQNGFDINSYRI